MNKAEIVSGLLFIVAFALMGIHFLGKPRKTGSGRRLAALALLLTIFSDVKLIAADATSTGAYIASISAHTYGTESWNKLGGSGTGGVGVGIEAPLSSSVGLRLDAEADSWHPHDWLADRLYAGISVHGKLNDKVGIYGVAQLGYNPKRDDVLARAGGGFDYLLAKFSKVSIKAFLEGFLEGSTDNSHGARANLGIRFGS